MDDWKGVFIVTYRNGGSNYSRGQNMRTDFCRVIDRSVLIDLYPLHELPDVAAVDYLHAVAMI